VIHQLFNEKVLDLTAIAFVFPKAISVLEAKRVGRIVTPPG
jgi:hypothetical protein